MCFHSERFKVVVRCCGFTSSNLFRFLLSHREEGGSGFLRNTITKPVHYTVCHSTTCIISEISLNGSIFPVFYLSSNAWKGINNVKCPCWPQANSGEVTAEVGPTTRVIFSLWTRNWKSFRQNNYVSQSLSKEINSVSKYCLLRGLEL